MTARTAIRISALRAVAMAAGLAGSLVAVAPAHAQISAAIGKPLPSPDLPVGTVTVRVVAGTPTSPVAGTTVTLTVNGTPREARTDDAGRASFPNLPPGATVVAKIIDEDKAEKTSESFAVPDSGGARLMLTTKPWQPGAGGAAPFAGGAGGAGMPNPRQLSGEGRLEQGDPAGQLTVRVTYDDFKDTPEGVDVVLVGYHFDYATTFQMVKTDKSGRAQFTDLDRSGGTSYFALTELPRNGAVDRLAASPLVLEAQNGIRMVLSSEKRASQAPPIDDLGKLDRQTEVPAGKLRVALEGAPDANAVVKLYDAQTKAVIAEGKPQRLPPDPTRFQGNSEFAPESKLPAGTLYVEVGGGPGQSEEPIPGAQIRVIPATAEDAAGAAASVTGADGTVQIVAQKTGMQKAVITINGRSLVSRPFDLSQTGGALAIRANWDDSSRWEAIFDLTGAPGQTVFAECLDKGQRYRSLPLQTLGQTGSKISIYVYPRVMFQFQVESAIEDKQLAVQGRFEVANNSWLPYRDGPDGLLVPLPKGFKGGVVFDPDQSEVAVDQGNGFRVLRPIPPFGRKFHGGFSLQVESGRIDWNLDLPYGSYQSQLAIRQTPGMTVHTPPKMPNETRTITQGTFSLLAPLTINPKQSMSIWIDGLPSPPAWRAWLAAMVGVLVVLMIGGGVVFGILGAKGKPAAAAASSDARRQALLDQLVELERTGGNPKRREQLLAELEQLWT